MGRDSNVTSVNLQRMEEEEEMGWFEIQKEKRKKKIGHCWWLLRIQRRPPINK